MGTGPMGWCPSLAWLLDQFVEPLEEELRLGKGAGAELRDEGCLLAQQLGGGPVVVDLAPPMLWSRK
jgi:hypothetical protein